MSEERPEQGHPYGYGTYGYGEPIENSHWTEQTFRRQLSILRRHLRLALSIFVIIATLGVLRAYRAKPVYESVAKILVERQAPRVTHFQDVVEPSISWWGSDYYKTQEQLVKSRAVLDLVLEDPEIAKMFESVAPVKAKTSFFGWIRQTIAATLGMPAPLPPEPWERLRGHVSAKHARDTDFLLIRAHSGNRRRASQLANATARAFVKYHMRHRLEISNDVFLYLQVQKAKEEKALREAEHQMQEFRESTEFASLNSSDSRHPVLQRLSLLNEQLTQTEMERIQYESEFHFVKRVLEEGQGGGRPVANELFTLQLVRDDRGIIEIREALVRAQEDLAMLSDVYGPKHPKYEGAQARIDLLETRLVESLKEIIRSLNARLTTLNAKEDRLRREYAEQNRAAVDLARQALAFSHLENEVERHSRLFEVLVQRMSEVELTSDYTRTNVEIVESAGLPKAPVGPNKRRMAVSWILLGLVLGIGVSFFVEHIDDTVRAPEDLERRVGIPVLGFVPEIRAKKDVESKTAYRATVSIHEPASSTVEAYRNIRTALFFSVPAEEARVVLISSGGPGDGKTTTATNLALVMAQSGKRVLVMDADFRRPMVHKVFGLSDEVGLSSVLVGEATMEEAVQKTVHDLEVVDKLDILAAGPKPANPTELLESASMGKLLEMLRKSYDRVIIDTPPVLFVSDTSVLSAAADGVILVVRSAKRTGAQAARARKQIERVHGRVIGGILNRVQVARIGPYYSDYYYHGYARYYRDYEKSYYSRKDDEVAPRKKRVGV